MVNQLKGIYLGVNGRFRSRKAKMDPHAQMVILNRQDKKRHLATEPCVFDDAIPLTLNSFEELLSAAPPHPNLKGSSQIFFAGSDSLYPISTIEHPSEKDRYLPRINTFEEAVQAARNKGSLDRTRYTMLTWGYMAFIGIVGMIGLAMAAIVIDMKFGAE